MPAAAQDVAPDTLGADTLRTDTLQVPDLTLAADTSQPLLTVAEARALVVRQNPQVAIARLDAEIAKNDASLGNAGFLPRLSLSAAQRRFPPTGREGATFRTGNQTLDMTASASVTVFEGLARVSRYRRLQTLAEISALDAEATSEALLADALVTYFDVAGQQQQLLVLREAVALSEERLRIAEGRAEVGAASQLEVRRALVDLNADRAALLRQETALAQAEAQLNRLLNRPGREAFRVEDSVAIDTTLEEAALEAAALAAAPGLSAARAAETAARLEATALRRAFWPALGFTLGYGLGDVTDPLLPPTQAGGLTYGLTATFDFFDANQRRRRLENARVRVEQQQLSTEEALAARLTALRSTYALYENSLALVRLEEENAAAARENAAVALERFRLGVSTSLELREVQRALIDAQSRLVAARFEAKSAEVDLLALAGLLLAE